MKLWYSPSSPFVRKVLVMAHETGLIDQIALQNVATTVINPDPELAKENPLNKIPVLVTDDGMSIFDSLVICEYLDGLHDGDKMIPLSGDERFQILVTHSMANGILDAAVLNAYERRLRPEEKQFEEWVNGQFTKISQTLDVLESWGQARVQQIHIGTITLACGLGYLDFRHPQFDWRAGRPVITQMYETFSQRKSMLATQPSG